MNKESQNTEGSKQEESELLVLVLVFGVAVHCVPFSSVELDTIGESVHVLLGYG